jgi:hypothetical protein
MPAALWLSDEFGYRVLSDAPSELHDISFNGRARGYSELASYDEARYQSEARLTTMHEAGPRYWTAILVRCLSILAILGVILGFGLGHLLDGAKIESEAFSASMLSIHFMYLILCAALFVLIAYYFIRGRATDTIIPCMNSKWYIWFTIFWYCLVLTSFIINAVEMRRTFCGVYTTSTPSAGLDNKLCALVDSLP